MVVAEAWAPPDGAAGGADGDASAALASATIADLRSELRRREEEAAADARAAAPLEAPSTSAEKPASVVILGAGPAGLAAAIYAARAGLRPIVVAGPTGGGQLEGKGVDVENFPGVIGASGPSLVGLMRLQASLRPLTSAPLTSAPLTSASLTSAPPSRRPTRSPPAAHPL